MSAGEPRARGVAAPLAAAARLAPARPAWGAGVRASVATMAPLVAGELLGEPHFFTLVGLAGFLVTLADKGGSYRARAASMAAATVACALGAAAASLVGGSPAAAVLGMLAWGVLSSLARAYGAAATSVGTLSAVLFVISLASPAAGPAGAALRALPVLAGGLWAMVLGLSLWPLRPYRPARLAVARCYGALAGLARVLARDAADPGREPDPLDFAPARQALEDARAVLAAVRRGRPGESPRGERLLILVESADQMTGLLVGLGDVLDSLSHQPGIAEERQALVDALGGFAEAAERIADAVLRERGAPEVGDVGRWSERATPRRLRGIMRIEYAAGLVATLREYASAAAEVVAGINTGEPPPVSAPLLRAPRRPLLEPLRAVIDRHSVVLRHAWRVGTAAALATALTEALHLQRGYWVTLTVLIVLQPYTGATLVKGLQRVAGTVVGAMVAALVPALVQEPHAVLALIALLATVSVALMPLNYGLYIAFTTPTFVLLAEVSTRDWGLVGVRVVNTLLGGVLALAAAWLLWSVPERQRLPRHLAEAVAAAARYLDGVLSRLEGDPDASPARLAELRRAMGLALINAEASLQRLVTEPTGGPGATEDWMAALAYLRRLGGTLNALSAAPPPADESGREALRGYGHAAHDALSRVEAALRTAAPPAPLPPLPLPAGVPPQLLSQLERVSRALRVLHAASGRGVG